MKAFKCTKLGQNKDKKYDFIEELPSEIQIIQIFDDGTELVLYIGNTNLLSKDVTKITLPKLILIRPGFRYEIQLKQTPPINCCNAASMNQIGK